MLRRFVRSFPAALLVCLLWAACTTAHAQDASDAQAASDEEARTHFQSGRLYFDRGDYDAALREFEAAYELSHRAALLYNIYLSLERLARPADAADRLEQFLADETGIEPDVRTNYESRIAHLRERAAQEATHTQPPPETPTDEGIGVLGIAGIATLAAGGVSLVVFAITGGMAIGEDSSVGSRCGESAGRTCTESDVSTLRTLTTTADVTMAIGLVLAAAGGVMLAIDLTTSDAPSAERVSIAPMFGPSVAGIQIGGSL